jgi:hypothetical protein
MITEKDSSFYFLFSLFFERYYSQPVTITIPLVTLTYAHPLSFLFLFLKKIFKSVLIIILKILK